MCTVTYLPRPSGFILTHNRDEAPSRSSQSIVREKTPGGKTLLFPRDTLAGGTWIATSREGRTACLLNGAFVLHKRELPYRRSRGLILLDFFDWENPDIFFERYDFERVEPFTMLFLSKANFRKV
ncbi:MAG: NRDE family protein [Lewinellaceae bacterium]|nr:NRDE family protein [Lewinellaceae bacterium]